MELYSTFIIVSTNALVFLFLFLEQMKRNSIAVCNKNIQPSRKRPGGTDARLRHWFHDSIHHLIVCNSTVKLATRRLIRILDNLCSLII